MIRQIIYLLLYCCERAFPIVIPFKNYENGLFLSPYKQILSRIKSIIIILIKVNIIACIKNCFQLRVNVEYLHTPKKKLVIDKNEWKHHILTFECYIFIFFGLANRTVYARCGNNSLARRNDVRRQKNKHCDRKHEERWQRTKKKNESSACREKIEYNYSKMCVHYTYTFHLLKSQLPRRSPRMWQPYNT